MAIEYLGLSEVNGPLVVLEGVKNASYEEIVEFTVDGNEKKLGRIVAVYEDKAVIQVFEGTSSMSLTNTHTRLTGHPTFRRNPWTYLRRYRKTDRPHGTN
mgnify:CR=1 FL=1